MPFNASGTAVAEALASLNLSGGVVKARRLSFQNLTVYTVFRMNSTVAAGKLHNGSDVAETSYGSFKESVFETVWEVGLHIFCFKSSIIASS